MIDFLWTQAKDWCNRWQYEEFKFEPRDIWVGVFWQDEKVFSTPGREKEITFYICVVPMLVLIVTFR